MNGDGRAAYAMPDAETLARATLTFCLNDADAIMYATIRGVGDARSTLRLLVESRPASSDGGGPARAKLDEAFVNGLVRWGRHADGRSMDVFHRALARWHERLDHLPTLDADSLAEWFTMNGTQWIIGPSSPFWPHQLDDLSIRKDWAAPLCLWGIGDPAALVSCPKPVAVVGSRGVNDYGRALARRIGERAASAGHLVVSGGAMGADAAAHWGALGALVSARGHEPAGRTVAVFAGGLNRIGPRCNQRLFEGIVDGSGALISELCPDTIPEGRRFLLRNRIIAALASTVVVTQARLRSGALNTANWAVELGREVYAAPGDAGAPYNAGCNRMIHDHQAILLMSGDETDEICHPPHSPISVTGEMPAADARRSPPVSSQATDATGDIASAHDTGHESDDARMGDKRRQAVCTAVRRCRRRGIPATVDAIADALDDVGLGELLALLGRMELDGIIRLDQGTVTFLRTDDGQSRLRHAPTTRP